MLDARHGIEQSFYEYTLNNNRLCLHKDHVIEIQVGRDKGCYRTRYSFHPKDFHRAIIYYVGLNVAYGYKKRIRVQGLNKEILCRSLT